jgi:hypothetical protein
VRSMSEVAQEESITMPRDISAAVRARSGPFGFSGCVTAAGARQAERDDLNELIQAAEAEHGPVSDGEVRALREYLLAESGR